jgi:filamentous hemagglutinin family protein
MSSCFFWTKFSLVCGLTLSCIFSSSVVQGQSITSDGTLPTPTDVTENGNVTEITGGTARGANLFHSFDDFSVDAGGTADFLNADNISRIFSRVTGGKISNIDGLIRTNDASLFLLNPAGIIFGAGARLDLGGGSFYGTTADSLLFEDGEFIATNTDNTPVLTINAPIGLNLRDNPASITVQNNGEGTRTTTELIDTEAALRVGEGATLGLLGGELIFEGATLKTPGGRIELGSIQNGRVDLTPVEQTFAVGYEGIENFGNIQLNETSTIDASGTGGGEIRVYGSNIDLNSGSQIEASTLGAGEGGTIEIVSSDALTLSGNEPFITGVFTQVYTDATGNGGNINITTPQLNINDGAQLSTISFGSGNAGNIIIDSSSGTISLTNGGQITADTRSQGNGGDITIGADAVNITEATKNLTGIFARVFSTGEPVEGGNITIDTGTLNLTDTESEITTTTFATGNAGDVTITASDEIKLDNASAVAAQVEPDATGNGGSVTLNTPQLSVLNGSFISVSTFGQGDAGTLKIDAPSGNVSIDGTGSIISAEVVSEATGAGGSINVDTGSLNLTNGGQISLTTFGQGDAGTLNIDATESVTLNENSAIFAQVFGENAIGQGGNVTLNTPQLSILNGSVISVSTLGQGNAGTLNINAPSGNVSIDGVDSIIRAEVGSEATGAGGSINVDTGSLSLTNGGKISADTSGQGNAGNLEINAPSGNVSIDGAGSEIRAEVDSEATGEGGSINLDTGTLNLINGGKIAADTKGQGNGGDINIAGDTVNISQANDSITGIVADVYSAGEQSVQGGDVNITATESITLDGSSGFISAEVLSNAVGDGGSVTLNTPQLSILNGGSVNVNASGIGNAGNLTINAPSGNVSLDGLGSIISANVGFEATGNGGSIDVNTDSLNLTNGGKISANTSGQGNAGNLEINAPSGNVSIDGLESIISANVGSGATGKGGSINIDTGSLNLTNGGRIASDTFGQGNGGDIAIAADAININEATKNLTGIFARVFSTGEPVEGGNITIDTKTLNLTNTRSEISSSTFATGNAGDLTITASDEIKLDNASSVAAQVEPDAIGQGGNVTLNTPQLSVLDGSFISVSTFGQGNAGNLEINAPSGNVSVDGTGSIIAAQVDFEATGAGGSINVDTGSLNLTNSGRISSSTASSGKAGNVNITASDSIDISDRSETTRSGILASARFADGDGGDVNITTSQLNISNGGTINVSNFQSLGLTKPGSGEAGNLTINAGAVRLDRGAIITAATRSSNGGNITFNGINSILSLDEDSSITAAAFGDANGGNITINAEDGFIVAFPSSNLGNDIIANAQQGTGGNIEITTQGILGLEEAVATTRRQTDAGIERLNNGTNDLDVTSASGAEFSGVVDLNILDIEALQGASELPTNPVEPETTVAQACSADNLAQSSRLVVNGKGGIPPQPVEPLNSDLVLAQEPQPQQPQAVEPIPTSIGNIYPARGVIVHPDGTFDLVAYETGNQQRQAQRQTSCGN